MNVLSLFSGIGGLDLGLQRAGMTIAGQVEIDDWCRKVLAKHWPEVPRHDDVRTCVDWWGERRAPDLVCGGFPCQPVSVAGKRLAQADERWLWPAMVSVVCALRPRFVLVENVPGLLAAGMGDVLGDLAACGYDAEWDCVSAADVGAPHLRKRIWIVAHATELHRHGSDDHTGIGMGGWQVPESGDDGRPVTVAGAEGECGELRPAQGERPGRPASRSSVANPESRERCPSWAFGTAQAWPNPAFVRTGEYGGGDHWAAGPAVGRVAHGIPRRVDRLRGLGNAVVPQVAEHIGRLIMAAAVTP